MIEERLKTEELLPDDVKIFFTTTKCKKGINIQNDDIKIMFAESSQRAELVQMAGRVRKGLDELNVMCELSRVYKKDILKWELYFSNESLQHVTNKYKDFISTTERPTKKDVIARIEENFPYITKADKKRGRESEYRIIPIPVESSQEDRIEDIPEDICI